MPTKPYRQRSSRWLSAVYIFRHERTDSRRAASREPGHLALSVTFSRTLSHVLVSTKVAAPHRVLRSKWKKRPSASRAVDPKRWSNWEELRHISNLQTYKSRFQRTSQLPKPTQYRTLSRKAADRMGLSLFLECLSIPFTSKEGRYR